MAGPSQAQIAAIMRGDIEALNAYGNLYGTNRRAAPEMAIPDGTVPNFQVEEYIDAEGRPVRVPVLPDPFRHSDAPNCLCTNCAKKMGELLRERVRSKMQLRQEVNLMKSYLK